MKNSLLIIGVTIWCSACAGIDGPGLPGSPSQTTPYIVGTWSGTATITPYGQPSWTGGMTWTIAEVPDSAQHGYSLDLRSTNAWFPVSVRTSLTLDPAPNPPGQISAAGSYNSPRRCVGLFMANGPATATTIDASFSGSDCQDENGILTSFIGSVHLIKE